MEAKQVVVAILTPLVTGSATFGAIALNHQGRDSRLEPAPAHTAAHTAAHAAAQAGPKPEAVLAHWPRQCQVLRQALLSQPQLTEVTYEARPLEPFVTPAWKLNWQGEVLALPLVNYSDVRVTRNEDGLLLVVLEDRKLGARVLINQLKQAPPLTDVFATVPHPSLALAQLRAEPNAVGAAPGAGPQATATAAQSPALQAMAVTQDRLGGHLGGAIAEAAQVTPSKNRALPGSDRPGGDRPTWDGPSLTERLFDGPVALESLIDQGYRHRPQSLSCKAEAWEKELPVAMGLAWKLSAGSGTAPEAAYARVGQQPGRVLRYRSGDMTTWQARFGEGEFYSDVTIALPSSHESAAVGLGLGQDNWWDVEPGRSGWWPWSEP